MTLPRMRTIKETIQEIKAIDANSAISEHNLRNLVAQNAIPYVKAGNKVLINLDGFIEYLQKPAASIEPETVNKIRRIC